MAVLVTAVVPGQTQEGYDQVIAALKPLLEEADGFIATGGGMSPEGWRIFELWQTQEQATAFFAKYIKPNLPPGMTPKRTYLELHKMLMSPQRIGASTSR